MEYIIKGSNSKESGTSAESGYESLELIRWFCSLYKYIFLESYKSSAEKQVCPI